MNQYAVQSTRTKKASMVLSPIPNSSLGREFNLRTQRRTPSTKAEEHRIQYLPSSLRIFKDRTDTRDRRLGSRRDHFSRLQSVMSSTLLLASSTPENSPRKGETMRTPTGNRPLSLLERFLEVSNQSSTMLRSPFHEESGSQKTSLRPVLPDTRSENARQKQETMSSPKHARDPTRRKGPSSKKYVRFSQIQFEDGKANVVCGRSRCIFPISPENLQKGMPKHCSKAVTMDATRASADTEAPESVELQFVPRVSTAA